MMDSAAQAATFGEVIGRHARTFPDGLALRFGARGTTYAGLDRQSDEIAQALLASGLAPGDRIAHLGKNSDRAILLLIGAAKAGIVLVPIIWRLAPGEIHYILEDSGARILFVDGSQAGSAAGLALPGLRIVQVDGTPADAEWQAFETWQATQPDRPVAVTVRADDVILQIYTSGTTGKPKGAMLTHANATRYRAIVDAAGLDWLTSTPGETALLCLPFGHIGGAGQALLILHAGQEMIIHPEFEPGAVLEAIEVHRLQRMFLVPAALQILLAHPRADSTDFSSLRYFSYGASPIPVPLLEAGIARLGCQFMQVYGMTETWGGVVALPPEDHDPARRHLLSAAGKPMPGVEVRIRDAEGHILPPGQIGEVEVRSPSNMVGYWNRAEATAETLLADGWLRTGDAGRLDHEGYLYIEDRIKDMIITGAENVYPAEVESVIYGHADVADVAVIGVPDDKWGEAVKAIVVPRPGASPDPAAIIAYARQHLAGFKCPKTIEFIDVLPRNPSGKILRRTLREPYWAGHSRRVN